MLPGEPAHADAGAVIDAAGFAAMVTVCDELDEQPFAVTVTARVVVPDAPAVKVMLLVLLALVMVPLVIVQAYVAPAVAGTLAVSPAVDGHVEDGAVIVAAAPLAVETVCVPLFEQPPTVTVTPRVTLPVEPAVKVMALLLVELVIVPLVIVQAYVAPACAGTLAELPVLFTHVVDGALMVALGSAVMATLCVPVLVQPFAVTVTLTVVVPLAPAVKLMPLPSVALVMVPLVIVQA